MTPFGNIEIKDISCYLYFVCRKTSEMSEKMMNFNYCLLILNTNMWGKNKNVGEGHMAYCEIHKCSQESI